MVKLGKGFLLNLFNKRAKTIKFEWGADFERWSKIRKLGLARFHYCYLCLGYCSLFHGKTPRLLEIPSKVLRVKPLVKRRYGNTLYDNLFTYLLYTSINTRSSVYKNNFRTNWGGIWL